ncbi:flagellar hook-length control protein FliK [Pseudomonas eucalypticola]|uniref:Flagellar hook-length control protein FliK n=1 Tax=Pseudomonas eucalypticola TaxID=2599595 RepID=A0A7D5GZD5_9PSED|nr:flagellar hook-length control protein FliK [Pseudomonas eucalypticola]QKZ03625.1 flagellar hook-length control protein FliK [Pseudomonas eucalypticola]
MSVASNPLLQITSTASTLANLSKAAEPAKDTSADFAKVYAKQSQASTAKATGADRQQQDQVATAGKNTAASDKDNAASKPAVADSGKNLPAHKPAQADKGAKADASGKAGQGTKADKGDKADKAKAGDQDDAATPTDTASTATTAQAPAAPVPDPTLAVAPVADPSLTQAQQPVATPDPAQAAALAQVQPPVQGSDASTSDADAFDPSKDDPLANMPTLRLALEQNAKAQGTTSAHAQTTDKNAPQDAVNADADQSFAAGLAGMVVQQKSAGESQLSDKAFDSQIDDGLKDIKGASADTRMDNFANRLAAMTDTSATTAKTATATPVQAPTTQLAMNQGGWTEGVVNRVMYLSSQNLKSADIQLTPAELGRLNIRVDMTPDQQTVTFTSAHVHVREALESQQGRLKDMFAEQGMGQLDVNVSDQSRQSSQDQAQQSQRSARGTGGADNLDGVDAVSPLASQPTVQQVVVGTSAIDYYA